MATRAETAPDQASRSRPPRKPAWLRTRLSGGRAEAEVARTVREGGLHTVCEEANCPNVGECWGTGTAAFMLLGDTCTRGCRFCSVTSGTPDPPDPAEPARVARAVDRMGLDYAVLTSVDRDDLPDQGAGHFAATIRAVKTRCPDTVVEALVPDFRGEKDCIATVLDAGPEVVDHNVETVRRLTPRIRDRRAGYDQSLDVLRTVKDRSPRTHVKTFLMLGHGETDEEVVETFEDLLDAGVDAVFLGQYLRPSRTHIQVTDYVPPRRFHALADAGEAMGFAYVAAGPLVRVSYRGRDYWRRFAAGRRRASADDGSRA